MNRPHNTEPQANGALARALMKRHPLWDETSVHAERTRVLQESSSLQVDILIDTPSRQPVSVETEFAPAATVERDAIERLGRTLEFNGEPIESAISVVLPSALKSGSLNAIETCRLRYATYHLQSANNHSRWPKSGHLTGTVDDLADAIEALSLSERKLAEGVQVLEATVRACAGLLQQQSTEYVQERLGERLKQIPGEQTMRMVAAILASAFVFHASIEGQSGIPLMSTLNGIGMHKHRLLAVWREILEVNYWPIFSIAKLLLEEIPTPIVRHLMDRLLETASSLASLGATTYHDLTGRMFQTLISDRKFLATFYTLPPSATLLAELAVERLPVNWSNKKAIEGLRIADFACGTGALLAATQRAVYRRHRRAGGDDRGLHREWMERMVIGMDIMPAATHLTCSMLSSAHPREKFGKTNIHTMPYGIDGIRTHIGSLDLLDTEQGYSLFATGESIGGQESDTSSVHSVSVKRASCDLVIMNPPFTRPRGHEGADQGVPISSFAGFGTPAEEQRAMAEKLKRCNPDFGHGFAGLASNFMDLGHRKLRDGGVLALVLPFTFVQGRAWAKARKALRASYSDIHIQSIVSTGSTDRAFSADTSMAECLVVATKRNKGNTRAMFSNLDSRPASLLEAAIIAKRVRKQAVQGDLLNAGAAGVRSLDVVNAAQSLQEGLLMLPRQAQAVELPIVLLGEVAKRGLNNSDISRKAPSNAPFDIRPIRNGEVATYPALWRHNANRERQMIVQPDTCGDVRKGYKAKAKSTWDRTASRLQLNQDFRLNSQSLAMCRTPEKCLGGRAWPNVIPHDDKHEVPLLLWSNSTLGLILFWWQGTLQQTGRAILKISAIPDLPVLDPRALNEQQMEHCRDIYDRFKWKQFLPANEAYRDDTRYELDRELFFGMFSVLKLDLNLEDSLDLLRRQWCAEPSVHGGKRTRPQNV